MSDIRTWSPFLVAYVGGTVTLLFESRIGDYLGIYSPLFGYAAVEVYAGALLGLVAALASRTWRGVLTFVLGLIAAAVTAIILSVLSGSDASADFLPDRPVLRCVVPLGFLGVPIYLIVLGIASSSVALPRGSGG